MIIKRSNDVTFTNQVKAQKLGICATEAKNNNPHDDHDSIPPDQILLELWNQHLLELAALCLLLKIRCAKAILPAPCAFQNLEWSLQLSWPSPRGWPAVRLF
ncbi:hypothetical protein POM88_000988 [Heracleum sosnowskyi]|uniref:Uncharacterized protein n=1 Tax=Heracleum sosnowskyi TaxID=360622 RepID=A0AAD8JE24_9APIA|nr:hypothetical protein POM88_000988 [Heracleum sosnowskyi]